MVEVWVKTLKWTFANTYKTLFQKNIFFCILFDFNEKMQL